MDRRCACGRSIRHRGRCSFRRQPKSPFVPGEGVMAREPVPIMADPLGRAVSVPLASVPLLLCSVCKGPKGRSPYAVCFTCMGSAKRGERRIMAFRRA